LPYHFVAKLILVCFKLWVALHLEAQRMLCFLLFSSAGSFLALLFVGQRCYRLWSIRELFLAELVQTMLEARPESLHDDKLATVADPSALGLLCGGRWTGDRQWKSPAATRSKRRIYIGTEEHHRLKEAACEQMLALHYGLQLRSGAAEAAAGGCDHPAATSSSSSSVGLASLGWEQGIARVIERHAGPDACLACGRARRAAGEELTRSVPVGWDDGFPAADSPATVWDPSPGDRQTSRAQERGHQLQEWQHQANDGGCCSPRWCRQLLFPGRTAGAGGDEHHRPLDPRPLCVESLPACEVGYDAHGLHHL